MAESGAYRRLKGPGQVIFAVGHLGPGMLNQFITLWLLIFLSPVEGGAIVKSSLVGLALLFGRIIDAVADPIVAQWSDRLRSPRFGRRLPFIILGAAPMILSFNLLWLTPALPDVGLLRFAWVAVWVNAFYFFYTVVVNPYFALLPEISESKDQRMFIQSFVSFFGILGMGVSMGASGMLIKAFGESAAGLILSLVCAVSLVGPAMVVRAVPGHEPAKEALPDEGIFKSIAGALARASFRRYIVGFAVFFLGFQLLQYNLAFFTTVLLKLDKGASGLLFITSVVAGLALIPVYNVIVRKTSPSRALAIAILSFVIVAALMALAPVLIGFVPARLLGFAYMAMLGFPYSGLMVIPNVLLSEIIDEDIAETGTRREAMFFGVQGLINNGMISVAAFSVGLLHDLLGGTLAKPAGVIAILPLGAAIALAGYVVIRRMNRAA